MTTTTTGAAAPSSPKPPSIVPPPTKAPSSRFTLELEFVLCLSNPYYLSHLAITYPHLLNPPPSLHHGLSDPQSGVESDASKFAAYLSYLYDYWRKPEYARFLSHPGVTLRNLELLQQERFRRDIIRPDIIEKLLAADSDGGGGGILITNDAADQDGQEVKEGREGKGAKIAQIASGQQQ